MNTVESRYKNPDKRIEMLQRKLKRTEDELQEAYAEHGQLYGEHQFSYRVEETFKTILDSCSVHPGLLPTASVRIEAHVSSIKRCKSRGTIVEFELDEVYLTENAK